MSSISFTIDCVVLPALFVLEALACTMQKKKELNSSRMKQAFLLTYIDL